MPRFFLHVCDGTGVTVDEEGVDLPDPAAAHNAAVQGLRDILAGELRNGHLDMACSIEIEDEHHELIATVTFAESVRVMDEAPPNTKR